VQLNRIRMRGYIESMHLHSVVLVTLKSNILLLLVT
jgi:hypothetical protein